jgi:hypothetical protein
MMNYPVKCANGNEVNIVGSDFAENPRQHGDNSTVIVAFHKRYHFDNESNLRSEDFTGWQDMQQHIVSECDAVIVKPLYLYDHSGLSLSTAPFGCRWDSGQIGFIYMTRATADKDFGGDLTRAGAALDAEAAVYAQYVSGDVHDVLVYDEDGNLIESLCGIYGADEAESHAVSLLTEYGGAVPSLPRF